LEASVYRTSGIGISIVLIAAGAVLAWAVTATTEGVDLNTVGLILFFVGLAGLAVSALSSMVPARTRDTTVVERTTADPLVVERPVVERPVVQRDRVEY
jgi:Domain of unknown function (DUF6458)